MSEQQKNFDLGDILGEFVELNPANYDSTDVEELQGWAFSAYDEIESLRAEVERLKAATAGFVRYCSECGAIGEVPDGHLDCCPDGNHAVRVPTGVIERLKAVSVPDVDWLSNVIRAADGGHRLGAGALAEKIVEAIAAAPQPPTVQVDQQDPVAKITELLSSMRPEQHGHWTLVQVPMLARIEEQLREFIENNGGFPHELAPICSDLGCALAVAPQPPTV